MTESVVMKPTIQDRADGVRGHYCIARRMRSNEPYFEFWNKDKWCSAAEMFIGLEEVSQRFTAIIEAELASETEWQDIESAPKDGTRILACARGWKYPLSVYWKTDFDYQYDERREVTEADYSGHYLGAWTDDAVQSFGYEEIKSYQPTHWMPLPTLPKEK